MEHKFIFNFLGNKQKLALKEKHNEDIERWIIIKY